MIFHFDIVRIDHDRWRKRSLTLPQLKALVTRIDRAAGAHGWNTSFLGNHDNPRMVSHFGDDHPRWRARSAKALATLMLTQRATPFLYQGDELGMTNFRSTASSSSTTSRSRACGAPWSRPARCRQELLAHLRQTSRDHSRTPMQWSAAPHAGFTTGTPWLAVHPNHAAINAQAQLDDPARSTTIAAG